MADDDCEPSRDPIVEWAFVQLTNDIDHAASEYGRLLAIRDCAIVLEPTGDKDAIDELRGYGHVVGISDDVMSKIVDQGLDEARIRRSSKPHVNGFHQYPEGLRQTSDEVDDLVEIAPALQWLDMSSWGDEPPPEREWAVYNRIPLRQTTLFSGEGAAGKSTVQLQLCCAHTLGRDWLGSMPAPGPAFFIDAEDDAAELQRRTAAIANYYQVKFSDMIAGGLRLLSLAGKDAVLAAPDRSGKMEPTALYKSLLEEAGDIKPKMIGIASSANVFAGNENARPEVQQFVSLLTRMAIAANGSVVLISHPSLTGINNGSGLSGSTSWHNAVRARFYMKSGSSKEDEQPDTDLREIQFKKNQYGPVQESLILRWQNGLFLPERNASGLEKLSREAKIDDTFMALLRRLTSQGRNVSHTPSPTFAPSLFAKEKEAAELKISDKEFRSAMNRLFDASKIRVVETGPISRRRSHIEEVLG